MAGEDLRELTERIEVVRATLDAEKEARALVENGRAEDALVRARQDLREQLRAAREELKALGAMAPAPRTPISTSGGARSAYMLGSSVVTTIAGIVNVFVVMRDFMRHPASALSPVTMAICALPLVFGIVFLAKVRP